ncbi:MAG TPA: hypothetical protein VGM52_16635, partial [Herbaspirillum sp.]
MPDTQPPQDDAQTAGRNRRRGKIAVRLFGALLALILLLAAISAISIYAIQSERGSFALWRTAVWLMQGRLSGQYIGGSVAHGVQMRDIHYRDSSTDFSITDLDGRWRFAIGARKLSVDYLHIGDVDLRLQPTPSEPALLPQDLRLPIAIDLNDLSLQKLSIREGTADNDIAHLKLHGSSDGEHHNLTIDSLQTAYGDANAQLHLSGLRPFVLSGGLALSGAYGQEHYQIDARLSGSLQKLNLALNASGDKLNGDAQIDAAPFDAVPLQRAKINLAHINPKTFNAGAPQADITLRADLQPAATPASASTSPTAPFTVTGTVSATNAIPGRIDQDRLPLQAIDADVTLSAARQQLNHLSIKLPDGGSIDGQGAYQIGGTGDNNGEFDLAIAALNLRALHGAMRPTRLHGPLTVKLRGDTQQVLLSLNDPTLSADLDLLIDKEKLQIRQA